MELRPFAGGCKDSAQCELLESRMKKKKKDAKQADVKVDTI